MWLLCVFGCISLVVESACVKDCRGLGLCTIDTVGYLMGGEYIDERGSVVTGWGRLGRRGEDGGEE
jgi:hypothetical protein